jgi:hypothetical protein
MYPVYCGYPWCASPRFGGEEDQQRDGQYPKEVQRSLTRPANLICRAELKNLADGNLDGYQKKKYV